MQRFSLDGRWTVRGGDESIPAVVPGCIHTDLIAAGRIDDPYYADNEKKQMWIGEQTWIYTREFEIPREMLDSDRIDLVCEGLDTLGTIRINGKNAGKSDNAFRIWRFELKRFLKPGVNSIEISFASTIPFIRRAQKKRQLDLTGVGHHRIDGSNQIRKSQCNYGWDWGPMCVTAGVWKPIYLEAYGTARIVDFSIAQDHRRRGVVALDLKCTAETEPASYKVRFTAHRDGEEIDTVSAPVVDGVAGARLRVKDPALWWPNGLGDQPLYEVRAELVSAIEQVVDETGRRIGLRTLSLERKPDKWGESFQFRVNGKPFFAKGANWIPADTFVTRLTRKEYERLVAGAADANMNMLRVWGGGIYESDEFYDLCDEYGICIWQDFMFACSAYPAYDPAYLENVGTEAGDTIRRIRHHPSIALWCGNNEIEQMQTWLIGDGEGQMSWKEYSALFDKLLPDLIGRLDPERAYWPSSPHTPGKARGDFNSPNSGDAHLWSVWHGREPFEWYRTCEHRFNSEFGFQSFPEPRVVASYVPESERNVSSYIMELHQRSGIGNDAIIQYMLSWFRLPTDFGMTLWLSQILQGMAIKYAVEHWRRKMPRGMGTLYWQLNDCWPVASWLSIDYYGNWKALNYLARSFYAPLLVSAVEDESRKVELYLTNDHRDPREGTVRWNLYRTNGTTVGSGKIAAKIGALRSARVGVLDLAAAVEEAGERNVVLHISCTETGGTRPVSENLVTFVRPKHLSLEKPEIGTTFKSTKSGVAVTFSSKVPALWVFPDLEGDDPRSPTVYSDRFFHLMPGEKRTITIEPGSGTDAASVPDRLRAFSLRDTYR